MDTIKVERHSEKHYTLRGKTVFGNEIHEYVCSGYLNQEELYDKAARKEITGLTALCKLSPNETQEETHWRLREAVFQAASNMMAYIPLNPMIDVEPIEPRKLLEVK